jgi:hypothetical protein
LERLNSEEPEELSKGLNNRIEEKRVPGSKVHTDGKTRSGSGHSEQKAEDVMGLKGNRGVFLMT